MVVELVETLGDFRHLDLAVSKCWNKKLKSDDKKKERLDRVINKHKHESVMEHLVYSFEIKGISRLCLQELARHRIASMTVKSTRYTLNELKNEKTFMTLYSDPNKIRGELFGRDIWFDFDRASKYIVMTDDDMVNMTSVMQLEMLKDSVKRNVSLDVVKYNLPECYKTELVWTINARSLKNFLKLRLDKSAHFEIRRLARWIDVLLQDRDEYFLFVDVTKDE
jgi:thymidylate synthase (FAD)